MKNLYSTFSQSTISISHLGVTNDEITIKLVGLAESYIHSTEGLGKLSKRVPFLIAESFQNVIRHGETNCENSINDVEKDFFQIDFHSDRLIISAANSIEKENVKTLNDKINNINSLSQEDLTRLKIKTLITGEMSSKGGAGLGLIEMARKSGMPIKKMFIDINEDTSIFLIGLEIIKKDACKDSIFNIAKIAEQYNQFIQNGVILQYSGPFSEDINRPLIGILENNFINTQEINSKSIENISMIIELLQNVSKHGSVLNKQSEGIIRIYEVENEKYISCGNCISPAIHLGFKENLDNIKAMSLPELKVERNKVMLEGMLSEQGDGGLGLLEIAIFTQNSFEYSFQKMPSGHYFYTMQIKLKNNG